MRTPRTTTTSLTRSSLAPRLFGLGVFLALATFVLVARGAQAQTATPTGAATATAAVPTPSATVPADRRLELAPIEAAEIQVLKSQPPQYQVMVTSGLPGGCAQFHSISSARSGNRVDVTVWNTMPAGNVPCTAIYGYRDSTLNLGSGFAAGITYTVVVNQSGDRSVTRTFTTDAGSPAPGGTVTPIAPPATPPRGTVPLPANVGTGGVVPVGARVDAMDAIVGGAAVATALLALSLVAVRVPRRRS